MHDIEPAFINRSTTAPSPSKAELISMVANIVSAYVSKNSLPASEVSGFITTIYAGLDTIGNPAKPVEEPRKEPAVSIKKSVTQDYIICLEDGKKFRTLKRHLLSTYQMTPEQYRTKWKLPSNYPMTAPSYSEKRSLFAKASGLGAARKGAVTRRGKKAA